MPTITIRTPDQRLRVFVSSTLNELEAERAAAREAIESIHLSPVLLVAPAAFAACGPYYGFTITSESVPLHEDDVVVYRMIEPGGGGWGTGTIDLVCDGDICRSSSGSGTDDLPKGTQVLVWLDLDEDDREEWQALPHPRDPNLLVPDDEDPRDEVTFPKGPGFRRIVVHLRLPGE